MKMCIEYVFCWMRFLGKGTSSLRSIFRQHLMPHSADEIGSGPNDETFRQYRLVSLISQGSGSSPQPVDFQSSKYTPPSNSHWKVSVPGLLRVIKASRVQSTKASIQFRSFMEDFPISITNNIWTD